MLKFNEMGKNSYLDFFVHCNVSQFRKKPGECRKKFIYQSVENKPIK